MTPQLADLLDDLDSHDAVFLLRQCLALLTERRMAPAEAQIVIHELLGDEGRDAITALGLAIQEIADQASTKHANRSNIVRHAKHVAYAAETFEGREHVQELIAALDTAGGRCDAMDQELRDKVKKLNEDSKKRPR